MLHTQKMICMKKKLWENGLLRLDCAVLVDDNERNVCVSICVIADDDGKDEVLNVVAVDKSCSFAYGDDIACRQTESSGG